MSATHFEFYLKRMYDWRMVYDLTAGTITRLRKVFLLILQGITQLLAGDMSHLQVLDYHSAPPIFRVRRLHWRWKAAKQPVTNRTR